MDVPVFDGERIVAVAGVGNKEAPYDENDVRQLMLLTTGTWRLVQRKQAEDRLRATAEALRRSEAHLAEAQRLTHTGSWVDDGNLKTLYWSEEVYRIFGRDPQQGLPTREQILERIHPDDRDKVLLAFEGVIQRKVNSGLEYRIVLPDGTLKYAQSIAHPVFDANGELLEVLGTTVDITDHKRADEALTLTSFALNNAHDAAALLNEYGRILYVNDEACRQSGYTRDELLAMHVWDVNPDFSPETWSDHWRTLQMRRAVTFESHHGRRDGGTFPVEISARYVEYEGRHFNVALVRDITERKGAEEALRRSESYLAEAQRLTQTGSWATDPTTGPLYWSEELYRIFGLDPQQGIPTRHRVLERIHPEDRDKFIEGFNRGMVVFAPPGSRLAE
jgi:PAS domain S-box-containing protein